MSRGFEAENYLALISCAYEAALECGRGRWDTIPAQIASALCSASAAVLSVQDRTLSVISCTTDIINSGRLSEYRSWLRQAWFNNPAPGDDRCSVRREHGVLIGLSPVILPAERLLVAVHRPTSQPFEVADEHLLAFFLPHLARALRVRRRAQASVIQEINRSADPTVIADIKRRILFANEAAKALLCQANGLVGLNGKLTASNKAFSKQLDEAIASVSTQLDAPKLTLIVPNGRKPLTLVLGPVPRELRHLSALPSAMLSIQVPQTPELMLTLHFGFTATEVAIAIELAKGKSLGNIACDAGIALNTVRVHLKNIFKKTGSTRQAQLVSMLLQAGVLPKPTNLADSELARISHTNFA